MITIIAEKPSVARQISRVVGAMERKVGYYGGNNYCVTWAFGHLIQLAMPEAYGVTGFRRESLPIIPDVFQLVSRKDAKGKEDDGVKEQLRVIKNLFEHTEKIISRLSRPVSAPLDQFTDRQGHQGRNEQPQGRSRL